MFIKRIFDVAISILGLIILLPMLIIIALIIKIKLGKPIFFIQERVGKRKDIKDENGKVLPDEKRHTTIGKTLRALSLDEIPELINVIKGDMSLVGPRPLLKEYLSLYSQEQLKRHQVLPGITGWAQINGRNAISWTEKFKLDIWYVCNWSLLLDLKILFLTIYKVIKKDGINQDDNITMEYFNGSN